MKKKEKKLQSIWDQKVTLTVSEELNKLKVSGKVHRKTIEANEHLKKIKTWPPNFPTTSIPPTKK